MSAIAADTKLETPEGPITAKTVLKSPTAVMTRTDDGAIRFAMTTPGELTPSQPVLRIALENGKSFVVGRAQTLLRKGMEPVAASDLRAGDRLEAVFVFPAGYVYKTDAGAEVESDGMIGVVSVEPAGEADVYAVVVERTGRFAFSAGALGVAD
jgi:hypothetical protein